MTLPLVDHVEVARAEHANAAGKFEIAKDVLHEHHVHQLDARENLGFLRTFNPPRPGCPYGNCGPILGPHDICGTTFYIACNMMLAFTLFFFIQVQVVPQHWKTSVNIAGLVTGIAWYNYTYMKQQWIETQMSPTTYRYTDWLITVPLQIVEFYFILKACGPVNGCLGLKLFLVSLGMVFAGWLAEINVMAKLVGFAIGMGCWLYIVYEVTCGGAAKIAAQVTSEAARSAFGNIRLIVTFGWTIYPIGFAIAYLCYFDQPAGVLSAEAQLALNVIYNLADLVNKGAFGLACWSAAVSDRSGMEKGLLA
jgi:bacteriorhodopsin